MRRFLIHLLGMFIMLIGAIIPLIPELMEASGWWSFGLMVTICPLVLFIGYWMYSEGDMDVFKESKVRIKALFTKSKP